MQLAAQPPLPNFPKPDFLQPSSDQEMQAPPDPLQWIAAAVESAKEDKDAVIQKLEAVALQGKSKLQSVFAAKGLAELGTNVPPEVLNSLKDAASGSDLVVAGIACKGLSLLGDPGLDVLRDLVAREDCPARAVALEAIVDQHGLDQETARSLLQDSNPMIRAVVVDAVADLDAIDPRTSDQLRILLRTETDGSVRLRVANALGTTTRDPALASMVLGSQSQIPGAIQRSFVRGLANNADEAFAANALGESLGTNESGVAEASADALISLGNVGIPALTTALENPSSRLWAIVALGEVGSPAAAAAEPLADLLADAPPELQSEILMTLGKIQSNSSGAADAIVAQLQSAVPSVRYAALFAVLKLNIATPTARETINGFVNSDDAALRLLSRVIIAKQNPGDPSKGLQVLQEVQHTLADPDSDVRSLAMALQSVLK
ncbi:MAG: HEAT repeat domain-containing protein [Planctomycetota bacterium]